MKTEIINIRISPDLKAQAQQLAESESRSLSNLIEHLIKKALKEQQDNGNG